jgi:hypothetical protein
VLGSGESRKTLSTNYVANSRRLTSSNDTQEQFNRHLKSTLMRTIGKWLKRARAVAFSKKQTKSST